jgi:hypothetical protein
LTFRDTNQQTAVFRLVGQSTVFVRTARRIRTSKAWQAASSSMASVSSSDWSESESGPESGSGPGSANSANQQSDASTVPLCDIDMPRERAKECSNYEPLADELSSRSPQHTHLVDYFKNLLCAAAPNGPDALVRFSTRKRRSWPIMSHLIDKQHRRSKYIGVRPSLRGVVALAATFVRQLP